MAANTQQMIMKCEQLLGSSAELAKLVLLNIASKILLQSYGYECKESRRTGNRITRQVKLKALDDSKLIKITVSNLGHSFTRKAAYTTYIFVRCLNAGWA